LQIVGEPVGRRRLFANCAGASVGSTSSDPADIRPYLLEARLALVPALWAASSQGLDFYVLHREARRIRFPSWHLHMLEFAPSAPGHAAWRSRRAARPCSTAIVRARRRGRRVVIDDFPGACQRRTADGGKRITSLAQNRSMWTTRAAASSRKCGGGADERVIAGIRGSDSRRVFRWLAWWQENEIVDVASESRALAPTAPSKVGSCRVLHLLDGGIGRSVETSLPDK